MQRIDNVINLLPIGFVLDMPDYRDDNLYVCHLGDLFCVSGSVSVDNIQQTIYGLLGDTYSKAIRKRRLYTLATFEFEGI